LTNRTSNAPPFGKVRGSIFLLSLVFGREFDQTEDQIPQQSNPHPLPQVEGGYSEENN